MISVLSGVEAGDNGGDGLESVSQGWVKVPDLLFVLTPSPQQNS